MRNITESSVLLSTEKKTMNTYKFSIIYADGTGIASKINIKDSILVKAIINKKYISIQGILVLYDTENEMIKIFSDEKYFTIKYSDLVYIYNLSVPKYNFDIVDYTTVETYEPLPDDPSSTGTGNANSLVSIINSGTGSTLIQIKTDNVYTMKTIKEGPGIKITPTNDELVITSTIESMTHDEVTKFIQQNL